MRILATLAVLAMTVAASPAQAQGRGNMTAAGLIGFEDGDGPAGLALRFDGEFPIQQIAPAVALSFVGSLGFTHSSEERHYGYGFDNYRWDWSLNIFKVVPAARFSFGRSQKLRPYADAGIGLYYASFTAPALEQYWVGDPYWGYYDYRVVDKTDSGIGLLLRLAAGLTFQVSPGFSLGGEFDITPYFGDVDDTMVGLMFVAAFKL